MDKPPIPAPASDRDQFVALMDTIQERFVGYRRRCSENEQTAAAKRRYDLAETYRAHAECWDIAIGDLQLAAQAYAAGSAVNVESKDEPTTPNIPE